MSSPTTGLFRSSGSGLLRSVFCSPGVPFGIVWRVDRLGQPDDLAVVLAVLLVDLDVGFTTPAFGIGGPQTQDRVTILRRCRNRGRQERQDEHSKDGRISPSSFSTS